MFIHFDMIQERDRRTDGRTPHARNSRAYAWHHTAKIMRKQTKNKSRSMYGPVQSHNRERSSRILVGGVTIHFCLQASVGNLITERMSFVTL